MRMYKDPWDLMEDLSYVKYGYIDKDNNIGYHGRGILEKEYRKNAPILTPDEVIRFKLGDCLDLGFLVNCGLKNTAGVSNVKLVYYSVKNWYTDDDIDIHMNNIFTYGDSMYLYERFAGPRLGIRAVNSYKAGIDYTIKTMPTKYTFINPNVNADIVLRRNQRLPMEDLFRLVKDTNMHKPN